MVWALDELRRVVIYVLDFDDELGRWLQGLISFGINDLGRQRVLSLFLTVQSLHSVNVSCQLVDCEDGACTLTRQHVLDFLAAHIQVCVQLLPKESGGIKKLKKKRNEQVQSEQSLAVSLYEPQVLQNDHNI